MISEETTKKIHSNTNIQSIVAQQKKYFNTNTTKDVVFRIRQLKKLKEIIKANEEKLNKAIFEDFKRSSFENYLTELSPIYHEIDIACKNVKKWAKKEKVSTSIGNLPGKSYIVPEPLGTVLVIGAWNFPYSLSISPTVAAIAAGCTVIIKPSELPIHTSNVMAQLINDNFDPQFLHVVEGGIPETTDLLEQAFDKIFFTGSPAVGKIVYQAAAKNLTPVTLELGGKSPAIFTESCNLKIGVKRMISGKFLNAGQICIAPDYVLVHKSIKNEFLDLVVHEIKKEQFSVENDNYVQIINEKNVQRVVNLLDKDKIHYGGKYDIENRWIEPTIMTNLNFNDKIMQEEIFGPVLPIIEYDDLDAAISEIKGRPKPLACYIFTKDKKIKNKIIHEVSFGGGAVNDALMHYMESTMPFGGVGTSGIGSYHGKYGFQTFTHYKSILEKATLFEPNLKYAPRTANKLKWLKRILG